MKIETRTFLSGLRILRCFLPMAHPQRFSSFLSVNFVLYSNSTIEVVCDSNDDLFPRPMFVHRSKRQLDLSNALFNRHNNGQLKE